MNTRWISGMLLLAGCASEQVAGGGDEMGNFIRVSVTDSTGRPVAGAGISIRSTQEVLDPSRPIPDAQINDIFTDREGIAQISTLPPGHWMLAARLHGQGRTDTLTLPASGTLSRTLALRMQPLCRLQGRMSLAHTDTIGWIRLPGRGRIQSFDSSGAFTLDSIEPGPFLAQGLTIRDTTPLVSTFVGSGTQDLGTLPIASKDWSWSNTVHLNTGTSGIPTPSVVRDIPVVLRLGAADVDFSRLRTDLADLRITRPDGRPLPHSVEKLDTLKDSLVVWVLVDSLEAGTDSQPFLIRGGNPAARPLNSSPFPASQGWAGVWNMGSGSSDQTGSGHDALDTNAYQTTGVIGLARYFDRTNKGHFTVPFSADLGAPAVGDFQVEAWARLDTKDSAWDDVVNQGDAGFRLQRFSNTNFLAFGFTDSATGEYVGVSGTTNIADGFFHHLVGMRRGDSLLVFVDGKRDGQKHWTGKARSSTRPITIAGNGSDRFFLGLIDEVRISRSARSDDWVHLSYESQRAGSPFLSR